MNYGLKDMWNDLKPFWIIIIAVFTALASTASYIGLQVAINSTTTTVAPSESVTETTEPEYVEATSYLEIEE